MTYTSSEKAADVKLTFNFANPFKKSEIQEDSKEEAKFKHPYGGFKPLTTLNDQKKFIVNKDLVNSITVNPFAMPSKFLKPPSQDSQKSNSSLIQENPLNSTDTLKKIASFSKGESPLKSLFDFKENNHLKKSDEFLPTVPLPKTSFSFKTEGLFKLPANHNPLASVNTNTATGLPVLANNVNNFKINVPFYNPFSSDNNLFKVESKSSISSIALTSKSDEKVDSQSKASDDQEEDKLEPEVKE